MNLQILCSVRAYRESLWLHRFIRREVNDSGERRTPVARSAISTVHRPNEGSRDRRAVSIMHHRVVHTMKRRMQLFRRAG